MSTITLVVIPGPGARTVIIPENSTVQDLVVQENLHGRDIIIDGQAVLPINFPTTQVPASSEVFATGSVKGNGVKNGPSTTGRPSGGGRGNNSPRGK